jgi:hypothetical protein
MTPLARSTLLAELGETQLASTEWRAFEARLDDLRRCLETDRCRDVFDALLAWNRAAPPGISAERWDAARETLFVRVARPLPLYLRGVSQLWLGEDAASHASLRAYLRMLPEPDPRSKAHALLESSTRSGRSDQRKQ